MTTTNTDGAEKEIMAQVAAKNEAKMPVTPSVTEEKDQKTVESENKEIETAQSGVAAEEEEGEMEPDVFPVCISTPSGMVIKLQVSSVDAIHDVKQYLFEAKEICHVTSYSLYAGDTKLLDFTTLAELSSDWDRNLRMVEEPYTERTAFHHVRRLRALLHPSLSTPSVYVSLATSQREEEMLKRVNEEVQAQQEAQAAASAQGENQDAQGEAPQTPAETSVTGKEAAASSGNQGSKKNKKGKKSNPSTSTSQTNTPVETTTDDFSDLLLPTEQPLLKRYFREDESETTGTDLDETHLCCLEGLRYSGWNPPPGNRRVKGDLFYLELKTLEGKAVHVTAYTGGFFVNATHGFHFNPNPTDKPYHSHTLVGLLEKVSPRFRETFGALLTHHFSKHPFEVLPVLLPVRRWLAPLKKHSYDLNRSEELLLTTSEAGLSDIKGHLREWNEEFQSLRGLPRASMQERLQRDRNTYQTSCEFVAEAIRGVKSIVEGNVPPLNPKEPSEMQMFVYGNVFYSTVCDARGIFREEGGDRGAWLAVNNDLKGVMALNAADIDGLHTLGTVVVDYRGRRMVAQSIIPGILHQTSASQVLYGSLDREEVHADPEFHARIAELAQKLNLKAHRVRGRGGSEAELYTAMETKGVRGTDGRMYLMDLNRLTPRDVNYMADEESFCTLRFELLEAFLEYHRSQITTRTRQAARTRQQELFTQYVAEMKKDSPDQEAIASTPASETAEAASLKKEEDATGTKEKDVSSENTSVETASATGAETEKDLTFSEEKKAEKEEEDTEKEKKENTKLVLTEAQRAELDQEMKGIVEKGMEELKALEERVKFNCDVFTKSELLDDPETIAKDENLVRELGAFLLEKVVPTLSASLCRGAAADSEGLKSLFHKHGVNLRYLGKVTQLVSRVTVAETLCLREMVVRGAKTVFASYCKKVPTQSLATFVSNFLNALLCPPPHKPQTRKKRSGSRKRNHVRAFELWQQIVTEVKKRYQYDLLPAHIPRVQSLPLLRSFCLKTGVVLVAKEYRVTGLKSSDIDHAAGVAIIVHPNDIMDLDAVVKLPEMTTADGSLHLQAGESHLYQQQLQPAFEMLTEALALLSQVHGPIHPLTARCYSRLAAVLFSAGDYLQALFYQKKATIINERVLGLDHAEVAECYKALSHYYSLIDDAHMSLECALRAEYICHLGGGTEHPERIQLLLSIGSLLRDAGQYAQALDILEHGLSLVERGGEGTTGMHSEAASVVCHAIALTFAASGDYSAAVRYQQRQADIVKVLNGVNSLRYKQTIEYVAAFTKKAVAQKKEAVKKQQASNQRNPSVSGKQAKKGNKKRQNKKTGADGKNKHPSAGPSSSMYHPPGGLYSQRGNRRTAASNNNHVHLGSRFRLYDRLRGGHLRGTRFGNPRGRPGLFSTGGDSFRMRSLPRQ